MINQQRNLFFSIKRHTDTLIEQTKTKEQEMLEYRLNNQMETFSFLPEINFFEEGKRLLAVSFVEATNSVFNITDENKSFSITTTSHWTFQDAEETIDELNNLLDLTSQTLDMRVTCQRV